MSIRREDKDFIESLSILGALLGTCIGAFMVMHLSDRAHRLYAQQSQYLQTQEALVKLSAAAVTPNNPIASKEVLDQVKQQIESEKIQSTETPKSFWLRLPRMGLWGLCGLGGFGGATVGFASVWLTGWIGSIFIYRFLRVIYAAIRKVAPNCQAATKFEAVDKDGSTFCPRDNKRLLPMVVKLFFFMLLSLALLTVVVWRLTSL